MHCWGRVQHFELQFEFRMQQCSELWRLVHSSPDGWRQEMGHGLERKLCDILRAAPFTLTASSIALATASVALASTSVALTSAPLTIATEPIAAAAVAVATAALPAAAKSLAAVALAAPAVALAAAALAATCATSGKRPVSRQAQRNRDLELHSRKLLRLQVRRWRPGQLLPLSGRGL